MEARELILNLVPGGVMPNIKVSQYDKGIPVSAEIWDGDSLYTIPQTAQVYVQGTKKDGKIYQYQCNFSGSTVAFVLTVQMTVTPGENIAEISIHNNGSVVGTINFVIQVEEGSLQDPSQTSYDDIPVIADIPELVEEAKEGALDSEAWAVGQRNGMPVPETDETYHNNSKYYAEHADGILDQLIADMAVIEAAARQASTSADLAAFCATSANLSATSAGASASNSEAWAVGKRGGIDVESTDPAYHNNAQYYAVIAADGARIVTEFSIHPPRIGANGNWWVYDLNTQQMVDTGIDASISLQIADVTMLEPNASPYVTNSGTSTDAIFHLFIPRGQTGAAGNGIDHIAKTGSEGRVDTYTIYYTNGTESSYTVTNGADGSGSVSTVNHVEPVGGNVQLAPSDIGALPEQTGTTGQVLMLTSIDTVGPVTPVRTMQEFSALEQVGKLVDAFLAQQAIRQTVVQSTLESSKWSNNEYSFETLYPSTTYHLKVDLDADIATSAQKEAYVAAQLCGSKTNKIHCLGTVPSIDIPIVLAVRRKV